MGIAVDDNWWQTLFDDVYLVTDARSVCDNRVTRRETDAYLDAVPLHPEDRILDLCGGHGRHSLELARRGYRRCVVLDYSRVLVEKGHADAVAGEQPVRFLQGDARRTALAGASFDHVFILGNSLGYMTMADADLAIFAESLRLLKPGGWLLADVTDGRAVKEGFSPTVWHEIGDDIVVCRDRMIQAEAISVREVVMSKSRGLVRDRTYRVRLYSPSALTKLLARAGFGDVSVQAPLTPHDRAGDYGCMNHRLLVTGRKK